MEKWRMQEKDREEGKGPIIWQGVDGEPHLPHDRRPAVEVPEGQREQLPGQAHEANQAKCSHNQEAREEGRVCRTCCSFDPSWRWKQVKPDLWRKHHQRWGKTAVEPDQPAGRMLSGDQGCLHPSLRHQPDLHDGVLRKVQGLQHNFERMCQYSHQWLRSLLLLHGRKAGGGNDQPEDLQGNDRGKVGCKSANQVPQSDESLQRLC